MPADDVLRPSDWEFYQSLEKWAPPAEPESPRSPEELTKDANRAHDNLKELVAERDRLQKAVILLTTRTKWLMRLLVASWVSWIGAFVYIFKWAAPWIVKGMMK
jgi:hypothetical protein